MCNPLAFVAVGQSVLSVIQQAKQVKAANDAAEQNATSAARNAAAQYAAQQAKQAQQRVAAGEKQLDVQKQATAARATASVSGAEAGVSGRALDSVLQDYFRQESTQKGRIRTNLDFENAQIGSENEAIFSQAKDRINAQPVQKFSPFLAALQIGTSAAGGYYGSKAPTR